MALALLCSASLAAGFYLPGVAPTDYKAGDELRAKVEALTSVRTQLPYEYYVLQFCRDGIDMSNQEALNLGEVLRGSRIYNTPYTFIMGMNQNCRILCHKEYTQVRTPELLSNSSCVDAIAASVSLGSCSQAYARARTICSCTWVLNCWCGSVWSPRQHPDVPTCLWGTGGGAGVRAHDRGRIPQPFPR